MNTNPLKQHLAEQVEINKAKKEQVRIKMLPQVEKANTYMMSTYGQKYPTGVPLQIQIKYWL